MLANIRLALNEHRAPFTPTLWHVAPDNTNSTVKQCWFPGGHASVGGGDTFHNLSDITLAWMVQQLTTYTDLEYDEKYLLDSRKTFGPNKMEFPWGCAPSTDSQMGFYKFSGSRNRTPGKYLSPDEIERGFKTNETIHRCVRMRAEKLGGKWPHPSIEGLKEDHFGPIEKKLSWIR